MPQDHISCSNLGHRIYISKGYICLRNQVFILAEWVGAVGKVDSVCKNRWVGVAIYTFREGYRSALEFGRRYWMARRWFRLPFGHR